MGADLEGARGAARTLDSPCLQSPGGDSPEDREGPVAVMEGREPRLRGHFVRPHLAEAPDTEGEVKPMRAAIGVLLSVLIFPASSGHKPAREVDRYLTALPKELKLREESPQRFQFTCDYFQVTSTGDPIRK